MDHIPLPSTESIAHLDVPYLGDARPNLKYDSLGFDHFPDRKGFIEHSLTRVDGGKTSLEEHACMLQSWCFFGLMIEVFWKVRDRSCSARTHPEGLRWQIAAYYLPYSESLRFC